MNNGEAITNRMFVVFGLILLIPCAILLQLLRVNFMEGSELRELWNDQAIEYISIPAQRGNIYDDNGSVLATNSVAYRIAVDPRLPGVDREQIRRICGTLAEHTAQTASACLRKIDGAPARSRYVVLNESIGPDAYEAVRALDNRAVILEERYRRRYSFGSLAAHTLGFVDHRSEGMIGLEKEYDDQLEGTDGMQQVRRDRSGRIFAYVGAPRRQPQQGHSLHTTIDSHIQAILEEELRAGIDRTGSSHGSAIVMDPRTGAIKAMANYPTFDPNHPASTTDENRRNYAISDMVEPGSTFKLVTAIAAVEQNAVSFDETFETPDDGIEVIHGQMMRDHEPLGTLTFPEVIQKSSNVATSRIARRLSDDTFYQYARNLGFGTETNIDLPGEAEGRLQKPYEWSLVTLPWMSVGYEVQVTPIQLIQAYAAFANGGNMMRPYLVDKMVNETDETVWEHDPVRVRRVANESTINKLTPVFQHVVTDSGTAGQAQVKGLKIAGKTGTAQKYIDGSYRTAYRASFVGYFPADDPRYIILVMLDEPKSSIYGGWTAGPIFSQTAKRIAGLDDGIERQIIDQDTLRQTWAYAPEVRGLELKQARALLSRQQLPFRIEGEGRWVAGQSPAPGTELREETPITLELTNTRIASDTMEVPEGYGIIPDVGGMSMRKASLLISRAGFEANLNGSGTVYTQFPRPGDMMRKGRAVTVRGKARSLRILAQNGGND